ncbi:hypothetical protein [Rugosimonospora africana]|uniref:Uncharacterized protein n=1 Tax=Rugosimonospora africana TaxID=556532 RepID=A0A8J3QLD3_9ACTN|nr:hypothetical protein [Rugosimonospora africana]GIH13079.1 hypothetical protein Raf01_12510 [Rugosimonospora africana]
MSGHFEVVFSVFLRDDTPAEVLAELRWHLGLSPERSPRLTIDDDEPLLSPGTPSYLPGGETATLNRQYRYTSSGGDHYAWGLHARVYWWTICGRTAGGGSPNSWHHGRTRTAMRASSGRNFSRR